ncbi:MAG: hypothetical protein WC897_00815 [Candidatus Gracilibacteria bacterium]
MTADTLGEGATVGVIYENTEFQSAKSADANARVALLSAMAFFTLAVGTLVYSTDQSLPTTQASTTTAPATLNPDRSNQNGNLLVSIAREGNTQQ